MAPSTSSQFDFEGLAQLLRDRVDQAGAAPALGEPVAVGGVVLVSDWAQVRSLLRSDAVHVNESEAEASFVTSIFHSQRFGSPTWPRPFMAKDGPEHAREKALFARALDAAARSAPARDMTVDAPRVGEDVVAWADGVVQQRLGRLFGLDDDLMRAIRAGLPLFEATFDVEVAPPVVLEAMVVRRRLRRRLGDHVRAVAEDPGPAPAFLDVLATGGCTVEERTTLLELAIITSYSTTRGLLANILALAAERGADLTSLREELDWTSLSAWGSAITAPVQIVRRRVVGDGAPFPVGTTLLLELGRADHHRVATGAPSPTLAFGAGVHRCPGRAVALATVRHQVDLLADEHGSSTLAVGEWTANAVLRQPTGIVLEEPPDQGPDR